MSTSISNSNDSNHSFELEAALLSKRAILDELNLCKKELKRCKTLIKQQQLQQKDQSNLSNGSPSKCTAEISMLRTKYKNLTESFNQEISNLAQYIQVIYQKLLDTQALPLNRFKDLSHLISTLNISSQDSSLHVSHIFEQIRLLIDIIIDSHFSVSITPAGSLHDSELLRLKQQSELIRVQTRLDQVLKSESELKTEKQKAISDISNVLAMANIDPTDPISQIVELTHNLLQHSNTAEEANAFSQRLTRQPFSHSCGALETGLCDLARILTQSSKPNFENMKKAAQNAVNKSAKADQLEIKVNHLSAQNKVLTSQAEKVPDLQKQLSKYIDENLSLSQQKDKLQSELMVTKHSLKEAEESLELATKELSRSNIQIANKDDRLNELESQLANYEAILSERDSLLAERENLQSDVYRLAKRVKKVGERMRHLQKSAELGEKVPDLLRMNSVLEERAARSADYDRVSSELREAAVLNAELKLKAIESEKFKKELDVALYELQEERNKVEVIRREVSKRPTIAKVLKPLFAELKVPIQFVEPKFRMKTQKVFDADPTEEIALFEAVEQSLGTGADGSSMAKRLMEMKRKADSLKKENLEKEDELSRMRDVVSRQHSTIVKMAKL